MAILEITRKFAVILLQGYVLIQNNAKGGREKKENCIKNGIKFNLNNLLNVTKIKEPFH